MEKLHVLSTEFFHWENEVSCIVTHQGNLCCDGHPHPPDDNESYRLWISPGPCIWQLTSFENNLKVRQRELK